MQYFTEMKKTGRTDLDYSVGSSDLNNEEKLPQLSTRAVPKKRSSLENLKKATVPETEEARVTSVFREMAWR